VRCRIKKEVNRAKINITKEVDKGGINRSVVSKTISGKRAKSKTFPLLLYFIYLPS
jgi:hypothetical protein